MSGSTGRSSLHRHSKGCCFLGSAALHTDMFCRRQPTPFARTALPQNSVVDLRLRPITPRIPLKMLCPGAALRPEGDLGGDCLHGDGCPQADLGKRLAAQGRSPRPWRAASSSTRCSPSRLRRLRGGAWPTVPRRPPRPPNAYFRLPPGGRLEPGDAAAGAAARVRPAAAANAGAPGAGRRGSRLERQWVEKDKRSMTRIDETGRLRRMRLRGAATSFSTC